MFTAGFLMDGGGRQLPAIKTPDFSFPLLPLSLPLALIIY